MAIMMTQAVPTRAAAIANAPNSGTATRMNMNPAPHKAPSSSSCAKEFDFNVACQLFSEKTAGQGLEAQYSSSRLMPKNKQSPDETGLCYVS